MLAILEKISQSELQILITVSSIIVLLMIVLFSVAISEDRDYKRRIKKSVNPMRVFTINIEKQWVTLFDLNSLKKRRTVNLKYFYSNFPDSNKVEDWIEALVKDEDVPNILETTVYINEKQKPIQTLLKLQDINQEKKIVHITSYLLRTGEENDALLFKKRIISPKKFVNKELSKSGIRLPGFTLAFYFQYADKYKSLNEIDSVIFGHIKNFFFDYLDENRFLVEENNNCLIFVDNETKQTFFTAKSIRESVIKRFDKYLSVNGIDESINVYVGGVINKDFRKNRDEIMNEAISLSEIAIKTQNNYGIVWYQKNNVKVASLEEASYKTEVERVLSERKIRTKYKMIYDVNNMSIYGYYLDFILNDRQFSNVDELREYALRSGDSKNLLFSLAKDAVPRFVSQKSSSSLKLLFPVLMEEKGLMTYNLALVPRGNEANIVLVFTENDILNRLEIQKESEIYDDIKSMQSKGYEVGIVISSEGLRLSSKLYSSFDVFLADLQQNSEHYKFDTLLRSSLHTIVEKLIKFKKPIICYGLDNWDSIELLVRSGLRYISGEALSPSSEMLLQLESRNEKRIIDMKG